MAACPQAAPASDCRLGTVSAPYPPIGDYALIGDCHSAALISRDASVDWCCFHRFDARPVFGRLLDWRRGGSFRIAPTGEFRTSRGYLPGTNILETRFQTRSGSLMVTDCFPVRDTFDSAAPVAAHPHHQLIRQVRCTAGEVEVRVEFEPRFDYGITTPQLNLLGDRLGSVFGGADSLSIQSTLPLRQTGIGSCEATAKLSAGGEAWFAVSYDLPHQLAPSICSPEELNRRLAVTRRYWEDWSARCTYDGPYRDAVLRSALVLKALTNSPSGAMVAAPTTSLPEEIGGVRNWDYRYSWLRDSSFTVYVLHELGYLEEAAAFVAWLQRTTAGSAEDLQVVYGVGGERLLPEVELAGLDGYRGSRPVRIGNAATNQFQLDVYGEVLDTAWLFHRHGGRIDDHFWGFLARVADFVVDHWAEPDEGMWEVRGERRHFVYSKAMAWVALDRALRLARALGRTGRLERWSAARDEIRRRIDGEGVDAQSGAFVQAFGSRDLDASGLLLPLVRFVKPDDPRVRATAERIERELSDGGLVYRYRTEDGLPGGEGAFLICSFWLVLNLALLGERGRAQELFERLLGCANDVGLLAEEVDPKTGELLGNFPQAFSHMGLINSALGLQEGGPLRK